MGIFVCAAPGGGFAWLLRMDDGMVGCGDKQRVMSPLRDASPKSYGRAAGAHATSRPSSGEPGEDHLHCREITYA